MKPDCGCDESAGGRRVQNVMRRLVEVRRNTTVFRYSIGANKGVDNGYLRGGSWKDEGGSR